MREGVPRDVLVEYFEIRAGGAEDDAVVARAENLARTIFEYDDRGVFFPLPVYWCVEAFLRFSL